MSTYVFYKKFMCALMSGIFNVIINVDDVYEFLYLFQ